MGFCVLSLVIEKDFGGVGSVEMLVRVRKRTRRRVSRIKGGLDNVGSNKKVK